MTQNDVFSTDCCYRKIVVTETEVQNSVVHILPNKLKTTISVQAMIKNKSFSVTADIELSKKGTQGVILTQGGRFGGWSLYMKDGKPEFTYNFLGLERYVVSSSEKLPMGATYKARILKKTTAIPKELAQDAVGCSVWVEA